MTAAQAFDLLSTSAQTALTAFDTRLVDALRGMPEAWAQSLGLAINSSAPKVEMPIPIHTAGYELLTGDPRFRSLANTSLSWKKQRWQDGVEEDPEVIEAPDWIGWLEQPEIMAEQAIQHWCDQVATRLADATETCWDGSLFFDNSGGTSHPFNALDSSLGTFDNLFTNQPVNTTSLEEQKTEFGKIKDATGSKSLGLRMTHILAPPALAEKWRNVLERDLIVESNAAVDNRHKGTVQLVEAPALTEDDYYYCLALNKRGMWPWAVQTQPLERMVLGRDSAKYERELKVGFSAILRGQTALLMPHCIQRVKTTS